ncbi:MAG: hypothetical protein IKR17_05570 [Bacteroidales bacterium]|nr:hypothetical protein [Bacteroidales bacterium]
MKWLGILILMLLLVCCKEKHYGYAKARITKIEYKTIGGGYYKTKFLCSFRYHGKEETGYALGQMHFSAVSEADIGDSILIKFDTENIKESVVRDIFYSEKNIYGQPVDNSFYRGKYNQLE